MLRHVLFDVSLFADDGTPDEESRARVLCLLEALVWLNRIYLQNHPETPLLYQSGVKYTIPEQFEQVQLPEVADVRAFLQKKGAPASVLAAFKSMADQLGSGEHFRDIPQIIANGGGDCLPVETLVQLWGQDGRVIPIGNVREDDVLVDVLARGYDGIDRAHATVMKVWPRSMKETITFYLANKTKLISSLDHRHMKFVEVEGALGKLVDVRARDLRKGDVLGQARGHAGVAIEGIEHTAARECVDITTSTGTFWLPETGVVTHNCDNLASWRVAELRELGIPAKPYITWRKRPDGGTTYHVVVLLGDGSSEDPSLLCGMGGASRDADRQEEQRKLVERLGDYLVSLNGGPPATSVFGDEARAKQLSILGGAGPSYVQQTPSNFGQGPQYSPTFWTDDAYESWSPTRPQAFYYNPLYPGGNIQQSGPLVNTRMRDYEDYADRLDGLPSGTARVRLSRALRRLR